MARPIERRVQPPPVLSKALPIASDGSSATSYRRSARALAWIKLSRDKNGLYSTDNRAKMLHQCGEVHFRSMAMGCADLQAPRTFRPASMEFQRSRAGIASVLPEHRVIPLRPKGDLAEAAQMSVGILINADKSMGVAKILLDAPGFFVSQVESIESLYGLAKRGCISAVVVDPEVIDGWLASAAEQTVNGIKDLVPVVLLCRHAADVRLLELRIARPGVSVFWASGLTAAQLSNVVLGISAAHLAKSHEQHS